MKPTSVNGVEIRPYSRTSRYSRLAIDIKKKYSPASNLTLIDGESNFSGLNIKKDSVNDRLFAQQRIVSLDPGWL